MAKKRKESKESKESKEGKDVEKPSKTFKVKTNVRLFRAEDIIWFVLDPRDRKREWVDGGVGPEGWWLRIKMGVDKDGDPVMKQVSSDWISVAMTLGFKRCEYVMNPDGIHHVLLYDEENINVEEKDRLR